MQKYKLPLLTSHRAPIQCYNTVAPALPTYRLDLINLASCKSEAIPEELKACSLDTIEQRYPRNEWLHIYTDGSYLPESNGAGAGWFCRLFEGSLAVGKYATNFDGEVSAVHEASNQLLTAGLAPSKVVFLVDSQAAIVSLSNNNPTNCQRTIQCRSKLAELILQGWTVTLQWVPSHVGIPGNEKADNMAKCGAEHDQPEVPMTLSRAKNLINNYINKSSFASQREESIGKQWETLAAVGPIPRHIERAEAVARFRLTTGHDFLGVHLHFLDLAADEACQLCGHARMDGDHLKQCTALALHPADDVVSRYWEARRQMAERPRMGVG
ncbi:reverse transcriptase [Lasius niger]|uniref:Reverse transcriptase n=1 Tax=Lasius niger TaxID=67767 RepID=A0A0J7JVV0_LASNI|nr:reverse transcriptase [Lasius niger]